MSAERKGDDVRTLAEIVVRRSYGKLVALLSARSNDPAAAEDALAEAFLSALEQWPKTGSPDNPEAWLLAVARRKSIDADRRQRTHDRAVAELLARADHFATARDEDIPDHRLALLFTCAHPAIDSAIRAPLMLQLVLGLNAERIAGAFLISPATMGQRLTRAKQKIKEAGIPFRIPEHDELADRLDAVLSAVYAAFAEGWTDPAGTDTARRDLADEALYLGGLLVELLPDEPETLGLLALMLHAEARRQARRSADGEYVPLADQDVTLWDDRLVATAETLLLRASRLQRPGRYQLEAAIQSAHVERRRTGRNNWPAIVELYDGLLAVAPSPVVRINRALARAATEGAAVGLIDLNSLANDKRLTNYQPYWAARADLLARAGASAEARHAYEIAIGLERDPAVRRFLQGKREQIE
jgi:RNA polymerase sigma-70 factor (ECF subfamily)